MWSRCIYLCLLLASMTACLDGRSSPNRSSGEVPAKSDPGNTFPSPPAEQVKTTESHLESCDFYPTYNEQPDWDEYFEYFAALKKEVREHTSLHFVIRNEETESVFHLMYNTLTWLGWQKLAWVESVELINEHSIEGCNYPAVRKVYLANDQWFYVINEWRTKNFYQPRHIVTKVNDKVVIWMDVFSASKFEGLSLYREVLEDASQKLFLRRRYGVFPLQVIQMGSPEKSIDNVQIMLTNRMNTVIGNLTIKYTQESLKAFLGPIEVFRVWDEESTEFKYLVEFGAEAPVFKGDEDGHLHRRAAGNFDRNRYRIRLVYKEDAANVAIPFVGEIIENKINGEWLQFSGSRPARAEVYE